MRPDLKSARLRAEIIRLQNERKSLLREYQPNSPEVRENEKLLTQKKGELAGMKKGEVERIFNGHVVLL